MIRTPGYCNALAGLLLLAAAWSVPAEEYTRGISVQATDEQPQVLYLVPWRTDAMGDPDEIFAVSETFRALAEPLDADSWLTRRLFRETLELQPVSAPADW